MAPPSPTLQRALFWLRWIGVGLTLIGLFANLTVALVGVAVTIGGILIDNRLERRGRADAEAQDNARRAEIDQAHQAAAAAQRETHAVVETAQREIQAARSASAAVTQEATRLRDSNAMLTRDLETERAARRKIERRSQPWTFTPEELAALAGLLQVLPPVPTRVVGVMDEESHHVFTGLTTAFTEAAWPLDAGRIMSPVAGPTARGVTVEWLREAGESGPRILKA